MQKNPDAKFELGSKLKDAITGFVGVATGKCDYISGCRQYLVQPPVKDSGEFQESRWFDEDRLELTPAAPVSLEVNLAGPDKPAPRK